MHNSMNRALSLLRAPGAHCRSAAIDWGCLERPAGDGGPGRRRQLHSARGAANPRRACIVEYRGRARFGGSCGALGPRGTTFARPGPSTRTQPWHTVPRSWGRGKFALCCNSGRRRHSHLRCEPFQRPRASAGIVRPRQPVVSGTVCYQRAAPDSCGCPRWWLRHNHPAAAPVLNAPARCRRWAARNPHGPE